MRYCYLFCTVLFLSFTAQATPILMGQTATFLMSGDIRASNPNYVYAELNLEALSTSKIQFTFNLLSSSERTDAGLVVAHESAKLDEFYFNLAGGTYSFGDIAPAGWLVGTNPGQGSCEDPSGISKGSGGACFLFAAYEPKGQKPDQVTVNNDLIFTVTKTGSDWQLEDFLDADVASGAAGQGIFGAHVQSLDTNCYVSVQPTDLTGESEGQDLDGNCSDSAFIFNEEFSFTTVSIDPDPDPDPIPEPAHLALFGLGLIAMGVGVRRRRQQ